MMKLVFCSSQTTSFLQESVFLKMPDFVLLGKMVHVLVSHVKKDKKGKTTLKPQFSAGIWFVRPSLKTSRFFWVVKTKNSNWAHCCYKERSKNEFSYMQKRMLQKPLFFCGEYSWVCTLSWGGHYLGTTWPLWVYTCCKQKQFTHAVKASETTIFLQESAFWV